MDGAIIQLDSPERQAKLLTFMESQMKGGTDFGIVPGTNNKPVLLKPGAEKLCRLFGLTPSFELIESVQDWTGKAHGEPLFYYWYKCSLHIGNTLIAQSDGSANSWEKKYRYREERPSCPKCRQTAIRKGDKEYYCWTKQGGCGAKFPLNHGQITEQKIRLVPNAEIFDQVNTLQKMAQKRALIGAVLIATGASEFFTQDLEEDGRGTPASQQQPQPQRRGKGEISREEWMRRKALSAQ